MPKSDYTNRRKLLKSVAGVGAIATGTSLVSAEGALPEAKVNTVLERPSVAQIVEIVGQVDVTGSSRKDIGISGKAATVTELETEYGVLNHVDVEGGNASAKLDIKNLGVQPGLRSAIEAEFNSIPSGFSGEAALLSDSEGVNFVREVTSGEHQELRPVIARATKGAKIQEAVHDSDLHGFRVFAAPPGNRGKQDDSDASEVQQYRVGAGETEISAENVVSVDSSSGAEVRAQNCPFTLACFNCANAVVGRGICLAGCATGPGPVCLACIASSTFYPLACVPCLDECG